MKIWAILLSETDKSNPYRIERSMMKYLALACVLFVATARADEYGEAEPPSEYGPSHIDRGFTCRRGVVKDVKYIGFKDMIYDTNIGSNYFNKDYGFFRAEVGGLFHFTFQVMSGNKYLRVSLRVNGKPQVWIAAQRGYNMAGNSATVFLKQGDVVYLYIEEGKIYEPSTSYRGYNTFTGHRLTYTEVEPIAPRASRRRQSQEEKSDYNADYASKVQW